MTARTYEKSHEMQIAGNSVCFWGAACMALVAASRGGPSLAGPTFAVSWRPSQLATADLSSQIDLVDFDDLESKTPIIGSDAITMTTVSDKQVSNRANQDREDQTESERAASAGLDQIGCGTELWW